MDKLKELIDLLAEKGTRQKLDDETPFRPLKTGSGADVHEEFNLPILIGDVLSKLTEKQIIDSVVWTEILFNWSKCGFTKSLQEIFEENVEVVCRVCNKHRDNEAEIGECCNYPAIEKQLTKEAQQLADFLYDLFVNQK